MAAPQVQYFTPPTFLGQDDEDGVEWLQRYEAAGRYNNWTETELFSNFERYIEGACRLWFQCLAPAPTQWEDIPEILAANMWSKSPTSPSSQNIISTIVSTTKLRSLSRTKIEQEETGARSKCYNVFLRSLGSL